MTRMPARIPLRIVFYRDKADRSVWVAHCLEFDLLGFGDTQQDAMDLLWEAIMTQLKNAIADDSPQVLFTPAPGEYHLMFAKGKNVAVGEMTVEIEVNDYEIDEVRAREYDDTACAMA